MSFACIPSKSIMVMCSLHPQCHEVSKADAFIQSSLQVTYSKDNLKLSALPKATMLMGSEENGRLFCGDFSEKSADKSELKGAVSTFCIQIFSKHMMCRTYGRCSSSAETCRSFCRCLDIQGLAMACSEPCYDLLHHHHTFICLYFR